MTGRCGAGVVCPTGAEMYPAACPVHEPNGCESPVTAPSPAAAGLPLEDVERVARALWETAHARFTSMVATWESTSEWVREHYRALAAAALAEMRPSPDSEAVARAWDEGFDVGQWSHDDECSAPPPNPYRAALAPVSHDADGGEKSESRSNPSNPYPLTRSPWSPR